MGCGVDWGKGDGCADGKMGGRDRWAGEGGCFVCRMRRVRVGGGLGSESDVVKLFLSGPFAKKKKK